MFQEIALLMHAPRWESTKSEIELAEGIRLCSTSNTDVLKRYHILCTEHYMDEGEPINYEAMVLLDFEAEETGMWDGPYSTVSEVANTVALCTSSPLGSCRLMASNDGFKSMPISMLLCYEGPATISLGDGLCILDDNLLAEITAVWNGWNECRSNRIWNALAFFYYAWHAHYLEHVCIDLAIVLESIFSPPGSRTEVSHQISFYASRFSGESKEDREAIYTMLKKFYSERSNIVHGRFAKDEKLQQLVPKVFMYCSEVLKRILIETDVRVSFSSESNRKALFSKLLHG